MSRLLAYGFGLGLVALVVAPGFGSPEADSYPLSTYPMFARRRDKPWLQYAEGIDGHGRSVRIAPELVANGEVMQAAATVRRAVEAGEPAMSELCREIARRATHAGLALREVSIVSARFDPIGYFVDDAKPEYKEALSRCTVTRSP